MALLAPDDILDPRIIMLFFQGPSRRDESDDVAKIRSEIRISDSLVELMSTARTLHRAIRQLHRRLERVAPRLSRGENREEHWVAQLGALRFMDEQLKGSEDELRATRARVADVLGQPPFLDA